MRIFPREVGLIGFIADLTVHGRSERMREETESNEAETADGRRSSP